jgi:hypothetical protein
VAHLLLVCVILRLGGELREAQSRLEGLSAASDKCASESRRLGVREAGLREEREEMQRENEPELNKAWATARHR